MYKITAVKNVPVIYVVTVKRYDSGHRHASTIEKQFETFTQAEDFIHTLNDINDATLERREYLSFNKVKRTFKPEVKSWSNPKTDDNSKPHNYARPSGYFDD